MTDFPLDIANFYKPCCRILKPFINICDDSEIILKICNETEWNDECGDDRHLTKWVIRDSSGNDIWKQEAFVNMSGSVPIGSGSTGAFLLLPNGVRDLLSFIRYQGRCFCKGETFLLSIIAKNCHGVSKSSNVLEFVACMDSEALTIGTTPLLLNGVPITYHNDPKPRLSDCEYTDTNGETFIVRELKSYNSSNKSVMVHLSNETDILINYSDFSNAFPDFKGFVSHLEKCSCNCCKEANHE